MSPCRSFDCRAKKAIIYENPYRPGREAKAVIKKVPRNVREYCKPLNRFSNTMTLFVFFWQLLANPSLLELRGRHSERAKEVRKSVMTNVFC